MPNRISLNHFFVLLLGLASVISTARGFQNALENSQDFQWSPSVLFWQKENPYTWLADGNARNEIILSQYPNYSHLLYVLLLPFTWLSWPLAKIAWAIVNIAMSLFVVFRLSKLNFLSQKKTLIVLFLFLSSTPFRSTVGNGQHGILVLFLITLSISESAPMDWVFRGTAYIKYSFMPPFFLFSLFKRKWYALSMTLLPILIGWIIFSLYLNENPFTNLTQPIATGMTTVQSGTGDVYSFIKLLFNTSDNNFMKFFPHLAGLIVCSFLTHRISKIKCEGVFSTSALFIVSLISFVHLGYDYLVLLPAFVWILKCKTTFYSVTSLFIITYFWFGLRFIHQVLPLQREILLNLSLLMTLLYCFLRTFKKSDTAS